MVHLCTNVPVYDVNQKNKVLNKYSSNLEACAYTASLCYSGITQQIVEMSMVTKINVFIVI